MCTSLAESTVGQEKQLANSRGKEIFMKFKMIHENYNVTDLESLSLSMKKHSDSMKHAA